MEVVDVQRPDEISGAIRRAQASGVEAINVHASAMLYEQAALVATAAIAVRVPAICAAREMSEAGCLASYGLYQRISSDVPERRWRVSLRVPA